MLKVQQEDEVKKKDWCDSEIQENTMQTLKAEDLSKDQAQKIEDLGSAIKTLTEEIATAKKNIADLQMADSAPQSCGRRRTWTSRRQSRIRWPRRRSWPRPWTRWQ